MGRNIERSRVARWQDLSINDENTMKTRHQTIPLLMTRIESSSKTNPTVSTLQRKTEVTVTRYLVVRRGQGLG